MREKNKNVEVDKTFSEENGLSKFLDEFHQLKVDIAEHYSLLKKEPSIKLCEKIELKAMLAEQLFNLFFPSTPSNHKKLSYHQGVCQKPSPVIPKPVLEIMTHIHELNNQTKKIEETLLIAENKALKLQFSFLQKKAADLDAKLAEKNALLTSLQARKFS